MTPDATAQVQERPREVIDEQFVVRRLRFELPEVERLDRVVLAVGAARRREKLLCDEGPLLTRGTRGSLGEMRAAGRSVPE
ncbi:hypothetical protein BRC94_09325 [Halobacteriales archaeon QS_5_70_17]|nr:MAG: hypothetical protein BRC94_09325 [Halobacteriales archaeon QS_5_70_17]